MEPCETPRLASFIFFEPTRPYGNESARSPKSASWTPSERPSPTRSKNEVGAEKSNKRRQEYERERPTENTLLQLCRSKDWVGVLRRCRAYPQESVPVFINVVDGNRYNMQVSKRGVNQNTRSFDEPEALFHETVLGLACASKDIDTEFMSEVILALVVASPIQVRCSQLIPGHTPLRDAILNPQCSPQVLKILLDGDQVCAEKLGDTKSAVHKKDRNGLLPIDHLIMSVQLGSSSRPVTLLKSFINRQPKADLCLRNQVSPLIRLLTTGTSFGVKTQETRPTLWKNTLGEDCARLSRILEATEYLLDADPSLLYQCSHVTGCSPLHVALRNYGNYSPLIQHIMSRDGDAELMKLRNMYGDLPIHVACSAGVPLDVLNLVLNATVSISGTGQFSPHPLIWTVNKSGYTPVDLEWVRHIEAGKGLYSARSFYPLEPSGMQKFFFKQDEYYQDLLREAVDQVIHIPTVDNDSDTKQEREFEAKTTFGILVDRIALLITAAASSTLFECPSTLLHNVCKLATPYGPSLPLPLMELFLWIHRNEVLTQDSVANLPLHYALGRGNLLDKPSNAHSCEEWKFFVLKLLDHGAEASKLPDGSQRLPLHILLDHNDKLVKDAAVLEHSQSRFEIAKELVRLFPDSVDRQDPLTRLYSFLLAAKDPTLSLDCVYFLLHNSPSRCRVCEPLTRHLFAIQK